MTFVQTEAPLRLKAAGFRKPLRLRPLRREGALEAFAVEGEPLEAVRFFPPGAVHEADGRLTAIPEATGFYASAVDAFEALGRRLSATTPRAALRVEAVTRAAGSCFWLQPPAGLTLEAWLADHPGRVAEPVVVAFARRLGEALGELHAAGIVHGDLSPRTVLIGGGEVRLTGFMIDRRPFFRPLRSQQGLVEPGYAPPEAHDGARRRPIGLTADLYAAAALLQRLLTGRAPPAANSAARVAGDNPWPGGIAVSAGLRAGVDAGLAPAAETRPANAAAWLALLDLGPEPATVPWFDDVATTTSTAPLSDPVAEPPGAPPRSADEPDPFKTLPAAGAGDEAPLTMTQELPARRRRLGWWAAGAGLAGVAIAAVASVTPLLSPHPSSPRSAETPKAAVAPAAPAGCQWHAAAGGWRLGCADAPAQGLRLPERFDAQTTERAGAGEPAAMERLGAFYRLRAGETANADRGAYAYQALGWLQRAAGAADDRRPDTARARDDAALALGQMLARGEGGRAPDPVAAERRLRQAAAGSRADAVLALGQLIESQASGDTARLAEARGLYARVAQLGDGSALQREGQRGLARIDAATPTVPPPPPAPLRDRSEAAPATKPPAARPAATKPATPRAAEPATKPAPVRKPTAAPARAVAKSPTPVAARPPTPKPKRPVRATPAVQMTPKPAATLPRRRATALPKTPPSTPVRPPKAALRTWTASTFIQIDPAANFYPSVEQAGRAACARDGGDTRSVRADEAICPNGVNYCQVRAVATCEGE